MRRGVGSGARLYHGDERLALADVAVPWFSRDRAVWRWRSAGGRR